MKARKSEVGIVMGSDSDWPVVQKAVVVFNEFGILCETRVISAHRTPDLAATYARTASRRGLKIIIAAAGGAAHLGGVLAAHTSLPVIGIPVAGGALNGLDALLATVQMPSGVPVATVTLGSAGPINAAVLAVKILAISRPGLDKKVKSYRQKLKRKTVTGDARVRKAARELQD